MMLIFIYKSDFIKLQIIYIKIFYKIVYIKNGNIALIQSAPFAHVLILHVHAEGGELYCSAIS